MNQVNLIGNLTKDPDVKYTQDQLAIARFSITINTGYGKKQRTDFPNIVVFGKQAENCERYLSKGRKVGITGRIQTGSYKNKEGKKVYTTDVIAERVEFLGGKAIEEDGAINTPTAPDKDFAELDEDVPF